MAERNTMEKTTQLAGDIKISMREKISYGLGDTSCNIIVGLTTSLLSFFYTDYIGVSIGTVGLIILISRFFDGISDVIMGLIVDRTHSKYGKARPWVLWSSVPYAIGCVLLFTVPAGSDMVKAVYIFITYNFIQTVCYTALNLPYSSLAALMTRNQYERGSINAIRMALSPFGRTLATAVTLPLVNLLGNDQKAWIMIAVGYAVIAMILLLICFLNCKEQENVEEESQDTEIPVGKSIGALFRNKYWLIVAGMFILWGVYFSLNGMMVSYYAQYVLGDNEQVTLLTLAEKIPLILSVLIAAPFVKKWGKRNVSMVGSLTFLVGAALMALYPQNLLYLTVGLIIRGIGGGIVGALIYGLLADTVEYGHWYTGIRNEGVCYCASAVGYKLGGGLTNALCGFVMDMNGFDGMAAVNPASAMAAIQGLYLLVPFIAYGGIALFLIFYHLDKEYSYVENELAAKRWRLGSTKTN